MESKLLESSVVTTENSKEVIECLECFDFCFKLTKEEKEIYEIEEDAFLFPCLRPKKEIALERTSTSSVLTIGMVISEKKNKQIGSNFFFRLQVIAR